MEFTYLENFEAESRKIEFGVVENIDMSEFITVAVFKNSVDYLK